MHQRTRSHSPSSVAPNVEMFPTLGTRFVVNVDMSCESGSNRCITDNNNNNNNNNSNNNNKCSNNNNNNNSKIIVIIAIYFL